MVTGRRTCGMSILIKSIKLSSVKFNNLFVSRMTSVEVLKRLESKATAAEQIIALLKSEVEELKKNQNDLLVVDRAGDLALENQLLRSEIEKYKNELVRLESLRGITQVPLAKSEKSQPAATPQVQETQAKNTPVVEEKNSEGKVDKGTKGNKGNKVAKEQVASESQEPPIDAGRLDFRVGKIVDAKKHPDADSLYVEEIDIGEGKNRTVVSGLVKYIPVEELKNRMVVLLCNLKPSKMRGVTSEAMVMCASTPDKVEILVPPPTAVPGDLVHVEGYPRRPDSILNPKKKIFETCAPDLKTDENRQAVYKGLPLHVPGKGAIIAPSLTLVQVK